jgi:N-acetyl sugar amidotransferase
MVKNNSSLISWCSSCLNTSTRPRITFDDLGRCNACQWVEEKKGLTWSSRELELKNLLKKFRSKNGTNDCIVPVSGGKDGSYVAYQLKHKYGMNPLAVTVTPALSLELGNENLESFIASGFDHLKFTLNPNSLKEVNRAGFVEWGFPYYGWLMGIMTIPVRIAAQLGINLIFYGEDGEVEYGGSDETKNTPHYDIDYMRRVYFEAGQDPVLASTSLKENDLNWFKFPELYKENFEKLQILHWSYYENWDPYRNYLVAKEKCGLKEAEDSNAGTFTNFAQNDQGLYALHTYLMYLKFGFGRATQDAGIEIRRGAMDRAQAVQLVKLYDGRYPEEWESIYLDYYKLSIDEFYSILERHTNKALFDFKNGRVTPKFEVK